VFRQAQRRGVNTSENLRTLHQKSKKSWETDLKILLNPRIKKIPRNPPTCTLSADRRDRS
jgi:hypothetical protein